MNDMTLLFQYLQVPNVALALEKFHYWDFFKSIAENFTKYRRVSEKQYNAIKPHIEKHLGIKVIPYNRLDLQHSTRYRSRQGATNTKSNKIISPYQGATSIQLYDLPYESGTEIEITVYPYSRTTLVTLQNGKYYKIPCPLGWEITKETTVKCRYKRTRYKGFLAKL